MKQFEIPKISDFTTWDNVAILSDFTYPWQKSNSPSTVFGSYYDQTYLHFRFVAVSPNPLVFVDDNNKLEVTQSERVELFFRSDEKMQPYYCLEIDPHGRVLDYKANFYREFDRNWEWPGSLLIETKIAEDGYSVQGRLSLSVLKELGVLNNDQIQMGLYRGHCTKLKDRKASIEWSSWVNPNTEEPDFHVPSSFGLLLLCTES